MMEITTTRFGVVEVEEGEILSFPQGLYGLEGQRRYLLIPHDEAGRFFWLQSADAPETAMVVTVPFLFFPDYEVEIPENAAATLQAAAPGEVEVYSTVVLAQDGAGLCLNLLGPVAVNRRAGVGMQLVQDPGKYSTRHLVTSLEPAEQAA